MIFYIVFFLLVYMNYNKKLNFYIYFFKNGILFIDIYFNFKVYILYKMVVIFNVILLNNNVIIFEDVIFIILYSLYNFSFKIYVIVSILKKFFKWIE